VAKGSRALKQVYRHVEPFSFGDFLSFLSARVLIQQRTDLSRRRGGRMVVLANDPIGLEINARGLYELAELEAIFGFLAPLSGIFRTGHALDIGANIGSHSIYFPQRFSKVMSFEPHPLMFRILDINASLYTNIHANPFGLSDQAGTAVLTEHAGNSGMNALQPNGGEGLEIGLRRLDDLGLDVERLALIKLDVEGHEAPVLRGGLATLERAKPIILFELLASDPGDKVEILSGLGYRFAWPEPITPGIGKYFRMVSMVATQRRRKRIVTGGMIERANHNMVIAIPPQWQGPLRV